MTTFDDRDKAFENKFAHDEELAFKVQARAHKLIGMWAAALMGKKEGDAESYAMQLVQDFSHSIDHLIEKLAKDFAALSITVPMKEIRIEVARHMDIARMQIMGDKK